MPAGAEPGWPEAAPGRAESRAPRAGSKDLPPQIGPPKTGPRGFGPRADPSSAPGRPRGAKPQAPITARPRSASRLARRHGRIATRSDHHQASTTGGSRQGRSAPRPRGARRDRVRTLSPKVALRRGGTRSSAPRRVRRRSAPPLRRSWPRGQSRAGASSSGPPRSPAGGEGVRKVMGGGAFHQVMSELLSGAILPAARRCALLRVGARPSHVPHMPARPVRAGATPCGAKGRGRGAVAVSQMGNFRSMRGCGVASRRRLSCARRRAPRRRFPPRRRCRRRPSG